MSTEVIVSVIMPNFNGQKFIQNAIQSVLEQTFQSFELLIIDDGSTDDSIAIIKAMQAKDSRVRLVQITHGGIVKALNLGIEQARGTFIARMDSDDKMAPDRLERQLAYCSKHKDQLVGTQAWLCDPKLRRLGRLDPPESHETIVNACLAGMASALMHPTLMGSKMIFECIGGYRESYRHIEDLDLYLRAARAGFKLANLNDVVGIEYRLHAQSVSNQKNQLQMELKHQLLQELEVQGAFRPDWLGLTNAQNMLPKTRSDFYRRWASIAYRNQRRRIGHCYLFKSITTPPVKLSKIVESLKLFKAYTFPKAH